MSKEYLLQLLQKIPMKDDSPKLVLKQKPNPFIEFERDSLTATYVGKNLIYSDITSIQSNRPADRENLIFYYEITIKDLAKSDISVGFADSDFPMNKHPGHTKNSYGYQSDGSVYSNKKNQKKLWKMRDQDVIGCGINYLKKEIFFTYNGIQSGPIFYDIDCTEYYPTLGMHGPRQRVKFNFGQEKFKFDLQSYIQLEKEAILQIILENEVHHYDIHQVIQSYLYFNGYFETLTAFESASKMQRDSTHLIVKDNSDGMNPIQVEQIRKNMQQKQNLLIESNLQNSKGSNNLLGVDKITGGEENSNSLFAGADSNFQCHSFQTSQMNENSISLLGPNANSNFDKINVEEDEEESKRSDNSTNNHSEITQQNGNNQNISKENNSIQSSQQNLISQILNNSTEISQQQANNSNQTSIQNGNSSIEQSINQDQNNNNTGSAINFNSNNENKNSHQNDQIKSNGNNNTNHNSNQNHDSNGKHNNNNNGSNHSNENQNNKHTDNKNNTHLQVSISNKQNQNQMQIEIDSPLFKKSMPFDNQVGKESSKDGIFSGLLDDQGCQSGGEQNMKQNISLQNQLHSTLEQNKDILEQFRSDVLKLIAIGKCEECIKKIQNELPQLLLSSKEILPNLYAQAFIERVKNGQILDAVIFAQRNLSAYQNETFYSYNENGYVIQISINELMGLVAIKDYSKYTGLQFLISQNQRYIVQDLLNKSILNLFGCADISILELILKQLQLIANRFKQEKYYIGEIYNLKV